MSSALGRRAVKVLENQRINSMDTMIHTSRHNIHHKEIFFWRAQAKLCRGPKQQRPNVHCRACVCRRDIFCVKPDSKVYAAEKVVGGDLRHGDYFRRVLHTRCVFAGTEDCDLSGGGAEGFLSFVALLSC